MSKQNTERGTMTELLRRALWEVESLREVERQTGVKRPAMALFRQGKQSLRLDKADTLAEYFGIECRMKRKGR